jgi:hypothetical protein
LPVFFPGSAMASGDWAYVTTPNGSTQWSGRTQHTAVVYDNKIWMQLDGQNKEHPLGSAPSYKY